MAQRLHQRRAVLQPVHLAHAALVALLVTGLAHDLAEGQVTGCDGGEGDADQDEEDGDEEDEELDDNEYDEWERVKPLLQPDVPRFHPPPPPPTVVQLRGRTLQLITKLATIFSSLPRCSRRAVIRWASHLASSSGPHTLPTSTRCPRGCLRSVSTRCSSGTQRSSACSMLRYNAAWRCGCRPLM